MDAVSVGTHFLQIVRKLPLHISSAVTLNREKSAIGLLSCFINKIACIYRMRECIDWAKTLFERSAFLFNSANPTVWPGGLLPEWELSPLLCSPLLPLPSSRSLSSLFPSSPLHPSLSLVLSLFFPLFVSCAASPATIPSVESEKKGEPGRRRNNRGSLSQTERPLFLSFLSLAGAGRGG